MQRRPCEKGSGIHSMCEGTLVLRLQKKKKLTIVTWKHHLKTCSCARMALPLVPPLALLRGSWEAEEENIVAIVSCSFLSRLI